MSNPVIFLSNRGPVQYDRTDGERTTGRGGGGLVAALSGLAGRLDESVWVCGALTEEDVREYCRTHLAAYKQPLEEVRVVVMALPGRQEPKCSS